MNISSIKDITAHRKEHTYTSHDRIFADIFAWESIVNLTGGAPNARDCSKIIKNYDNKGTIRKCLSLEINHILKFL